MMIDQSTKDWLQRMAYGFPAGGKGGQRHTTEGSEHAIRILAALDDADHDDSILASIEGELDDPDDLKGQVARLVELRGRFIESIEERDLDHTVLDESMLDDHLVAMFSTALDFRIAVREMLVGTGVLAETDQTSDPINLLRLFLPSPAKVDA